MYQQVGGPVDPLASKKGFWAVGGPSFHTTLRASPLCLAPRTGTRVHGGAPREPAETNQLLLSNGNAAAVAPADPHLDSHRSN